MRSFFIFFTFASLLILGGAGCSTDTNSPTSNTNQTKLADLTFTDYAGNSVRIHDFIGTPLVVNSWATWCPFCRQELPDLAEAQEEFGDAVKIIAIDRVESLRIAKQYSDDLHVTDKILMLLDPSDRFYLSIGGFAMPETIFVDKKGNIQFQKRGFMTLREIKKRIETLINE